MVATVDLELGDLAYGDRDIAPLRRRKEDQRVRVQRDESTLQPDLGPTSAADAFRRASRLASHTQLDDPRGRMGVGVHEVAGRAEEQAGDRHHVFRLHGLGLHSR